VPLPSATVKAVLTSTPVASKASMRTAVMPCVEALTTWPVMELLGAGSAVVEAWLENADQLPS
jgi:hypothetical protein